MLKPLMRLWKQKFPDLNVLSQPLKNMLILRQEISEL